MLVGIVMLLSACLPKAEINEKEGEKSVQMPEGVESRFDKMGVDLSDQAEGVVLKGVAGEEGSGAASVERVEGKTIVRIIADLPELEKDYWGYLVDGEAMVSVGELEFKKGGWILDFETEKDISSYRKVEVVRGGDGDYKRGVRVLEGSW